MHRLSLLDLESIIYIFVYMSRQRAPGLVFAAQHSPLSLYAAVVEQQRKLADASVFCGEVQKLAVILHRQCPPK